MVIFKFKESILDKLDLSILKSREAFKISIKTIDFHCQKSKKYWDLN